MDILTFKEYKELQDFIVMLTEMTNLDSEQTGIDGGIIYLSVKNASHGCRIKFEPTNEKGKEFIVSIPDLEIVIDSTKKLDNIKKKQVVKFATVYSKKLLNFWNYGKDWNKEGVTKFKKILHLSNEQLNALDTVMLNYKKKRK